MKVQLLNRNKTLHIFGVCKAQGRKKYTMKPCLEVHLGLKRERERQKQENICKKQLRVLNIMNFLKYYIFKKPLSQMTNE